METLTLNEYLYKTAEKFGWKVVEDKYGYTEFAKFSPAGEDFCFAVESENLTDNILDYYESFDPEAHAAGWICLKNEAGMENKSIPDIYTLLDDAENIDGMLYDLYTAIKEAEEDWEYENELIIPF